MAHQFEYRLLNAIRQHIEHKGISAYAYRNKQFRYQDQLFDILVDSADLNWYLAIECKSINGKDFRGLYFSQYFGSVGGCSQLEREYKHLALTGRQGWLAVELRGDRQCSTKCYFFPFEHVYGVFKDGDTRLPLSIFYQFPCVTLIKGKYNIVDQLNVK